MPGSSCRLHFGHINTKECTVPFEDTEFIIIVYVYNAITLINKDIIIIVYDAAIPRIFWASSDKMPIIMLCKQVLTCSFSRSHA